MKNAISFEKYIELQVQLAKEYEWRQECIRKGACYKEAAKEKIDNILKINKAFVIDPLSLGSVLQKEDIEIIDITGLLRSEVDEVCLASGFREEWNDKTKESFYFLKDTKFFLYKEKEYYIIGPARIKMLDGRWSLGISYLEVGTPFTSLPYSRHFHSFIDKFKPVY